MTQEEKQLLLKVLCAMLPYGVRVLADLDKEFDGGSIGVLVRIEPYVGKKYPELKGQYLLYQQKSLTPLAVDEVKPYLRPMSSMTEEEIHEIKSLLPFHSGDMFVNDDEIKVFETNGEFSLSHYLFEEIINFYNSHHFDYCDLIEKGLALEAPEDMYKTE